MMPPRLMAATTLAEVQLEAVPVPTHRVGSVAADDVDGIATPVAASTSEATRTGMARVRRWPMAERYVASDGRAPGRAYW
jgi:hypothetical protein